MNQRLSAWLLLGAFLLWPLTAQGQETNLKYDAKDNSQHAVIPDGGPFRDLTPNWSLGFGSGAEYS
jgi:hypothetical protein